MGLVEEIKNLHPELHIDPVAFFEDLVRRKVDIVKPGPPEGVSSQVAIGPGRRPRKGTRIIVQVRSSQLLSRGYTRATCCNSRRGIAAEARVQVGTVRRPPVPVCGTVRSHARGKGFPCAERANSINRPAIQNHPYGFLLEAEWKGVGASEDKIVSRVEGGRPVPTEYSVRVVAVAVAGQRLIPFSGRMTALFIAVLASLRALIHSRLKLAAEILAPDTILRWHRQLIAREWTAHRRRVGRPGVLREIGQLAVRMAQENPTWGYRRIQGALKNLGHRVARSTIADILRAHGIGPVPKRPMSWRTFLAAHWGAIAAADFLHHRGLDRAWAGHVLHAFCHRASVAPCSSRGIDSASG